METIRIGTFNAENLFARFKFKGVKTKKAGKTVYRKYTKKELEQISKDGWDVDKTKFSEFTGDDRRITAAAIQATKADILGMQEIESMDTLKKFVAKHLKNRDYAYKVLIDGNDLRLIDVALLVDRKHDIAYIRTHQFERTPDHRSYLFSRDCLEVGVKLSQNTVLPVFVNHFKSMVGGREQTMARRKIQAERVVEILKERFGPDPGQKAWVVLGDLNDYLPSEGLDPLLGQPWLENVVNRIPKADDRWTHFYSKKKEYKQLDYILLSKGLADANPGMVPAIIRGGVPKRAERYKGKRFKGVGQDKPKASDHCPVVVEVKV